MKYPYASENLLEQPQQYMYTPFEGAALLEAYFEQRGRAQLESAGGPVVETDPDAALFESAAAWLRGGVDRRLAEVGRPNALSLADPQTDVSGISPGDLISTDVLLRTVLESQLSGGRSADVKIWLDRLVQRFEVTKKLYKAYEPSFRKGQGSWKDPRVYCLFALALCLYYTDTRQVKYLSTWLKVADLLSTLPADAVYAAVPSSALALLFAAEVAAVRALAESNGVVCAAR